MIANATTKAGDRSSMVAKATEGFSRSLIDALCKVFAGGEELHLDVPVSLREKWGVAVTRP
jgi:hypothetical protein